jgi:hypothetical protein
MFKDRVATMEGGPGRLISASLRTLRIHQMAQRFDSADVP